MNFNSIVRMFRPKDHVFFTLFEEVSNTLEEMAVLLEEGASQNTKEQRLDLSTRMKALEHKNDQTTHQIFVALGQNFITPLDREDIYQLTSSLDNIADEMYGAAKKMALYGFFEIDKDICDISEVIHQCVLELKDAIHELGDLTHPQKIKEVCIQINSLENNADDIYDNAVAHLFAQEGNLRQAIVIKDILYSLEAATDKCEDAANVLESIIIKYS